MECDDFPEDPAYDRSFSMSTVASPVEDVPPPTLFTDGEEVEHNEIIVEDGDPDEISQVEYLEDSVVQEAFNEVVRRTLAEDHPYNGRHVSNEEEELQEIQNEINENLQQFLPDNEAELNQISDDDKLTYQSAQVRVKRLSQQSIEDIIAKLAASHRTRKSVSLGAKNRKRNQPFQRDRNTAGSKNALSKPKTQFKSQPSVTSRRPTSVVPGRSIVPLSPKRSVVPAKKGRQTHKRALPPPKKSSTLKKKTPIQEDASADDQCRVCLTNKSLVSIYKIFDRKPLSDRIVSLCNNITIVEDDLLPQSICKACIDQLNVAANFKSKIETTDKKLRAKLAKIEQEVAPTGDFIVVDINELKGQGSASTSRRATAIVIADADTETEADKLDFNLTSPEASIDEDDSDSDSEYGVSRKIKKFRRRRLTSGPSRSGKKLFASLKLPSAPITSTVIDGSETLDISSDDEKKPPKKRKSAHKTPKSDGDENKRTEHVCLYCKAIFLTATELREHRKIHAGEKPFACNICARTFKLISSFNSHLASHKDGDKEDFSCSKCNKLFVSKTERKKHIVEVHNESLAIHVCEVCKKAFTAANRLERHKAERCPGPQEQLKKGVKREGTSLPVSAAAFAQKDLFKYVAPLSTTYWSDDISD